MPLPVLLQEVASELQLVNDGEKDLPDWQRDLLPKMRHVIESEDWLVLPTQWEIHDYRIMKRFFCSIEQDEAREQLL